MMRRSILMVGFLALVVCLQPASAQPRRETTDSDATIRKLEVELEKLLNAAKETEALLKEARAKADKEKADKAKTDKEKADKEKAGKDNPDRGGDRRGPGGFGRGPGGPPWGGWGPGGDRRGPGGPGGDNPGRGPGGDSRRDQPTRPGATPSNEEILKRLDAMIKELEEIRRDLNRR
jgi:hypothetical protein